MSSYLYQWGHSVVLWGGERSPPLIRGVIRGVVKCPFIFLCINTSESWCRYMLRGFVKKNERLTLVEILAVVVILGILAVVAVPSILGHIKKN